LVLARLREVIGANGGWISFARYMEIALYEPALGYYAGAAPKFGAAGDFVTAPELGALFGRTLARQLKALPYPVLEFGAGSGSMSQLLHEAAYRVDACDLEPELFQFAAVECRRANLAERLPYDDATFDGIVCVEVLEHIDGHEQLLCPEGPPNPIMPGLPLPPQGTVNPVFGRTGGEFSQICHDYNVRLSEVNQARSRPPKCCSRPLDGCGNRRRKACGYGCETSLSRRRRSIVFQA
jgi:hypothetical protein